MIPLPISIPNKMILRKTKTMIFIHIYKYDQSKWPYPSPNTNFSIPQHSDSSIQTQLNSATDYSVGAHDVASYGLYQSTNYHGIADVKDNDYSQSFETARKNNLRSSCFGDTFTTTIIPFYSRFLNLENNIYDLKQKARLSGKHYVINHEH